MNAKEKEVRYERVVEAARALTHRHGWWTMSKLSKELGFSPPV
jgi:hypothetical protein